jgi:UDP-2,3-diacylglucosamine pyrophosphatase LpxH
LLVLSDLHLGSDLVHHARPDAPERSRASERCDRDLVAVLDWYREHRLGDRPWRLVIGGDFIDFTGMSVMREGSDIETALTPEERQHGLGGTRDHTLAKLELVMQRHAAVMQSLANFASAGNSLVILRGNHDIDWHWRRVQRAFRRELSRLAPVAASQIDFAPWFYYEEGRIYIEHGHQYDAYCSCDHFLYPVRPGDSRRTTSSLSDVLVRYVVRPTRGMNEAGHDQQGLLDYVKFAARLGALGLLALLARFARASAALVFIWREHMGPRARRVRQQHERNLRAFGLAHRLSPERLQALVRLQRFPVTHSLRAILTSVMLDKVLLVVAAAALGWALFATLSWPLALPSAAAAGVLLLLVGRAWQKSRTLEPSAALREGSKGVVGLFPAAFVVMGHTHLPEVRATTAHTTYVNLGTWIEEDTPDGVRSSLPSTRTHLVVGSAEGGASGELRVWSAGGPKRFEAETIRD